MTVLARLLTLSIRLLASGGSKLLIMLLVTTPGAFAKGHFKNYFEKKFPQDTVDIHSGMFTTYTHSDKYYWEIPVKLFGADILVTKTALKAAAQAERPTDGLYGFANDMVEEGVIRFVKSGNRIDCLEVFNGISNTPKDSELTSLYRQKNNSGRYLSIPILEEKPEAVLIDVSNLLNQETLFTGLALRHGRDFNISICHPEFSSILEIGSNREDILFIRSQRAYEPSRIPSEIPNAMNVRELTMWQIGTALTLLPRTPLSFRKWDPRVEYFSNTYQKCDNNIYTTTIKVAKRWRLEPRPEDFERYEAGELVVPIKPIIFYVDRQTPEYLRQAFIEAVDSWQKAFEQAGFKNAIKGEMMPAHKSDPEFSIDDPRISIISYNVSPRMNARGGIITDPRSGEILSGRVSIFHSFLDLIQQWYYCQCAQVDPRIHEEIIPDTLLARIAKFVVTHEVGHSLGLCHNFIGSSAYTVEQLRTPDFVAKYGTTPSIMDYTRFNYIAQPEDKMDSKLLSPNVGIYDCFAIEWGYRYYRHHANSDSLLKEWVTQQQEQRELRFANNSGIDPEVQSEDLSNDLLAANALGIENLKYMKSNEPLWRSGEWANRQIWINRQSWMEIQYNNFLTQAILYIGGINTLTQQPIPIRKQLDAIEFINKYAFSSPEWLFGNHRRTSSFYQEIIRSLIQRCEYVQNSSERYPNNTISIKEYITVLHQTIFDRHQTDRSREILQEVFCKSVLDAMKNSDSQYMKMLWRCELENILDEARQKHFNPQHGQRITDYIKFCMGK